MSSRARTVLANPMYTELSSLSLMRLPDACRSHSSSQGSADEWILERDGFCVLTHAVDTGTIQRLLSVFDDAFEDDSQFVRARSSRGYVYAARNLIDSIPEVTTVWHADPMLTLLREVLGDEFGLVRALFFDKPPERTWNLPWHKDTSISVNDNSAKSATFSRPTIKAGVPHVIASDEVLRQMLTLRIYLDEVTDENGPLRVIPESHVASDSWKWQSKKGQSGSRKVGQLIRG